MRHAIVGAGFGADAHLPAFSAVPGVQVVGLADSGSGRAKQRARGAVACFSHWAQMLDEARPDTLSIAVPPLAQTEIALAALARGIHVLCEKPVGRGVSEAQQICEAARRASLVAAVTFQFRFEPGLQSLQREFRDGRIGGLRRLDFSWITAGRADSTRPWSWQHDASQGGGVLTAFMPHVADLIAWLTHD
ncbi:MAG TPA: Gfo/Idh/MocA family oxidoreductase, partial [Steroidobacteraceae bacterium]|nr:Gfo/Idh/MocA family oxidoreductase [Steroidobacteraceae bacterium]